MTLFRFAFIAFILIGFNSNAQYIQGRVIEISNLGEEIPIAEAKVYWQGTTISTITDLKGRFSIQDTSLILSASFIGYQIDSQMVVNNQYIFILESLLDLDEVVIKEKRATTQYSLLETVNLQTLNSTELEKAACCNLSECFETNSTVDVAYTDAVSGTGQHEDYHKPTDDVEKINFQGMYKILLYVEKIIQNSNLINDFDFQETAADTNVTPKFSVTLGVMPDYLYDGIGFRIDGVTKGKTASKHNILKGDVVLKMGDTDVTDIMTYMKALSRYNSGDTCNIVLQRGSEEIYINNLIFD